MRKRPHKRTKKNANNAFWLDPEKEFEAGLRRAKAFTATAARSGLFSFQEIRSASDSVQQVESHFRPQIGRAVFAGGVFSGAVIKLGTRSDSVSRFGAIAVFIAQLCRQKFQTFWYLRVGLGDWVFLQRRFYSIGDFYYFFGGGHGISRAR